MNRILFVAGAALIILAAQGCQGGASGIDAAALLEERCSECHKPEIPKNARKSRAEWEKTVARMIDKGAKLSPDEKRALVRYLSRVYKL